ncbi:hypothetical protein QYS49_01390 [Marivirga salinae]|uniref:Uncharacterized protein n=1 Tax=Marivirga salinarum TaxID=3059078 RepID=A0AA49GEI4_9BACT|nr:hypothetical protein [Marivirga sp. BDSF4-3]WKK76105.2 hypothetical protein QYS49_01390 [Marivirga sp. BDSF4-3]
MKKFLRNGLMLAAAGTLFFTACDPEEETPVESAPEVNLSVETEQDTYLPGDVINLVVDFTADAPVVGSTIDIETTENTFTLSANGISDNIIDLNAFSVASETEGSFTIEGLQIPDQAANMTLSFLVSMEDEDGRTGEGTLDIEVGENQEPLVNFSAILLAAPLQDDAGSTTSKTSETFFSTNTGETYSMAQVNGSSEPLSANIDFGYFYGSGEFDTEATIASPAHYPFEYGQNAWGARNNTLIRATTVTESQFNEANLSFITEAFENGAPGNTDGRIVNLAEGDVLAFETDGSKDGGAKKGLLLVESITPGDGENGQIEFSIVMEE